MPELREAWQSIYDRVMRSGVSSVGAHEFRQAIEQTEELETKQLAWEEAFLAVRTYNSNNNGENTKRYRAAVARLKELKLIN